MLITVVDIFTACFTEKLGKFMRCCQIGHNFKRVEYLYKLRKEYLISLTPKIETFFWTKFGNFSHISHLVTNCYKIINCQIQSGFFGQTCIGL